MQDDMDDLRFDETVAEMRGKREDDDDNTDN